MSLTWYWFLFRFDLDGRQVARIIHGQHALHHHSNDDVNDPANHLFGTVGLPHCCSGQHDPWSLSPSIVATRLRPRKPASPHAGIIERDDRPLESLFVEAREY